MIDWLYSVMGKRKREKKAYLWEIKSNTTTATTPMKTKILCETNEKEQKSKCNATYKWYCYIFNEWKCTVASHRRNIFV